MNHKVSKYLRALSDAARISREKKECPPMIVGRSGDLWVVRDSLAGNSRHLKDFVLVGPSGVHYGSQVQNEKNIDQLDRS